MKGRRPCARSCWPALIAALALGCGAPARPSEADSCGEAGADSSCPDGGAPGGTHGKDAATALDAAAKDLVPPVPVTFAVAPTLTANPNSAVPLAGILTFKTNVLATAEATVTGGDETWRLALPAATDFLKAIVGLKPQTTYTVTVMVSNGTSRVAADPLTLTTPPLPSGFPPIAVATSQPAQMEPGMTLFNVRTGWSATPSLAVIVDPQGAVRWFYQGDNVTEDHRRLPNGNFLFAPTECLLEEVDIRGNLVRSFQATKHPKACTAPSGSIPVAIDSFHHEDSLLPSGNFLVLSTELHTVESFPTSDSDPKAATRTTPVITCVIVEFQPDGKIVKYIPISKLLDPLRIGRGAFDHNWSMSYAYDQSGSNTAEWDHANSVVYDSASDSYYVSLRLQDAVIKVNRTTEALTWILGTPANWKDPWKSKLVTAPSGFVWHYHQHAAKLLPDGRILMYDNGNYRAAAYESVQPEWSRVLIVNVDEAKRTVTQDWSYGDSSGSNLFFSSAMGDADLQPATGNILFVNSQMQSDSGASAEIVEVTAARNRVFDLKVKGGGVFTVYRAERIADIRQ